MSPRALTTAAIVLLATAISAAEAVRASRATPPGLDDARPGELLIVLDETVIRAQAVRYGSRRLAVDPVGTATWRNLERGNSYTYNSTTRALVGNSRIFSSGMEQGR